MTKITGLMMGLAVAAAVGMFAGCEGDPSAPSRPRMQADPLAGNEKAKENAEKRETEPPAPDYPTSGKEFPGQSKGKEAEGAPVVTAYAGKGWMEQHRFRESSVNGGDSKLPETRYNRDYYPGPLPHLPENPGMEPMAGSTVVPGTEWAIDHSWGQVLVLTDYPHRDWSATRTTYDAAVTKMNTPYFFTLQDQLPVPQNSGSGVDNWISNLYEWPWFYLQTGALPVTMFIQRPLAQETQQRLGSDPNYFDYLPATGAIVPAPVEGVIRWEYPFLMTTNQDVTTLPASPPIAPTPGMTAAPEAGAPGPVVPIEPPSSTPGLK